MSNITVEHRGYTIRFNENSDEWTCPEAGYYSHQKLSTVKTYIDKMTLAVRKKSALLCFEIDRTYASKTESKIIEYLGQEKKRNYSTGNFDLGDHRVAVVAQRGGSDRATRSTMTVGNLMPDTPEAHDAFERYLSLHKAAEVAAKTAREAFNAIPRVTVDMIPDLVRIATEGTEE